MKLMIQKTCDVFEEEVVGFIVLDIAEHVARHCRPFFFFVGNLSRTRRATKKDNPYRISSDRWNQHQIKIYYNQESQVSHL